MRDAGPLSGSTVLVTGATGFIGTRLVAALRQHGCDLHCVSRSRPARTGDGIIWWRLDMTHTRRVASVIRRIQPDYVFHLAGSVHGRREIDHVVSMLRANCVATVNLLTALASTNCRRIVVAGSMEEAELNETVQSPGSPYAAAKTAARCYLRLFADLYGCPVVHARIHMVYGPGQVDLRKVIPYAILAFLNDETPHFGSGRRSVDWIYVDDVVDALITLADTSAAEGRSVDVGAGETATLREVVEELAELTGSQAVPQFESALDRPMETTTVADIESTRSLTGWRQTVPLRDGLARTVAWYRDTDVTGRANLQHGPPARIAQLTAGHS